MSIQNERNMAREIRSALYELEQAESKEKEWLDGVKQGEANLNFTKAQYDKARTVTNNAEYRLGVLIRGGHDDGTQD